MESKRIQQFLIKSTETCDKILLKLKLSVSCHDQFGVTLILIFDALCILNQQTQFSAIFELISSECVISWVPQIRITGKY
jgi:hypothetical protein